MAAKTLISSSTIAIRLLVGSFTHASLCACSVSMALSIASWLDGGILPVTVGNWGEPLRVAILMAYTSTCNVRKLYGFLTCQALLEQFYTTHLLITREVRVSLTNCSQPRILPHKKTRAMEKSR